MTKGVISGIILGLTLAIILTKSSLLTETVGTLNETKQNLFPTISPTPTAPPKPDYSSLKDVLIENIEIGDIEYRFDHGNIERIDKKAISGSEKDNVTQFIFFYQMTLEDPLFTSPGFDVDGIKKTKDVLTLLQTEYNKVSKREINLFPLSLLGQIPIVYAAEKNFFDNASDRNAENLISAYENASQALKKDIRTFSDVLLKNSWEIPDTSYASINSRSNKKTLISAIEKVVQNSDSISSEIKTRRSCLEKGLYCIRPFAKIEEPKETELLREKTDPVLPVSDLFPWTFDDLSKLRGPYIIQTPCFGWGKGLKRIAQPIYILPKHLKTFEKSKFAPVSNFRFKLASNNFYRKVAKDYWEKDFDTKFEYTPQTEDNPYICQDIEYQLEASTLDYFWQNYRNNSIFKKVILEKNSNSRDFFTNGKRFEESFFSSTPPSWTNLEILASYYLYAYKILPSEFKPLKDEFLKRFLTINRKLGNFPETVNGGIGPFINTILKEKAIPGFTLENKFYYVQLYINRSLWNYLYFPYSPSFWRRTDRIEPVEKVSLKTVNAEGPHLDYKIMKEKFSSEEIREIHKKAAEYNVINLNVSF